MPTNNTSELKRTFDSVTKALIDACELAPKQLKAGKQLVLMTNASFRNAGYALMIEENLHQKIQSNRKTYARVAFGSNLFSPAWRLGRTFSRPRNSGCPYTRKKFWQSTWHFLSLHILCGKQPNQQLFWQITNLSHVFSKPKQIPPHCGMHVIMCCISTLKKYNSQFSQHCGWLSLQTGYQVQEKLRLKVLEDIQTTPIEVPTSSSDVADEEQFFFAQADNEDESEEQNLKRKERPRHNAKQWVANEDHHPWKQVWMNLQRSAETLRCTPWMESRQIPENGRSKMSIWSWRTWNWKNYADHMMKCYLQQTHDINTKRQTKTALLLRMAYNLANTSEKLALSNTTKFLRPKQVVNEVLRSLHEEFGKHPGFTKTSITSREKKFFPKNGAIDQEMGYVIWAMHQRNANFIAALPAFPWKSLMITILGQKTPCKLIWCRNFLRLVAMRTLWQP